MKYRVPIPVIITVFLLLLPAILPAEADMTRLRPLGFSVPDKRTPAPEMSVVTGPEGNTRNLPRSGEVTLLNFWATWCPPCRAEMPSLNRLKDLLEPEGLHIAAVNVNEEIPFVRDYMDFAGLDLTVYYYPEEEVLKAYKLRGIPSSWIIDRNGRVAAVMIGSIEWDHPEIVRTLRELLAEKPE